MKEILFDTIGNYIGKKVLVKEKNSNGDNYIITVGVIQSVYSYRCLKILHPNNKIINSNMKFNRPIFSIDEIYLLDKKEYSKYMV